MDLREALRETKTVSDIEDFRFNILDKDEDADAIRRYCCVKNLKVGKSLSEKRINFQDLENNESMIINENKNVNSQNTLHNYKFSLDKYLTRISTEMLSKRQIRNMILNIIGKDKIDLENLILFRKLQSKSKKQEYVNTLVKIIMNVMKDK